MGEDFLAALDIGFCGGEGGGGGVEFGCEVFSAEGFPAGFELGDLLFEGLALFADGGGVVEIAQGVAGEGGGPGALGGIGAEAGVGEGTAAAGADAEAGAGADGEFAGVGEDAGFAGG